MSEVVDQDLFEKGGGGEFEPPPGRPLPSVLERLGPSPFPRSGFPLLGFLATVYDHVAEDARRRLEEAAANSHRD